MLNQLSGLSSPPLAITPLTIVSSHRDEEDLAALRVAAPSAVVRGGTRSSLRTNRNTVVVLDRCGRMVYQQTLQRSDANLQSVEAAILSAHLDDPCGPCHLPSQEEPSHGRLDQVHDDRTMSHGRLAHDKTTSHGRLDQVHHRTSSQAKMSGIANAYASISVADSGDTRRIEVEETPDQAEGETVSETTTTGKPERKQKKTKKKTKKDKRKKAVKRVRAEERDCDCGYAGTRRDCECAVEDDVIAQLIGLSETANEILGMRDVGYLPAVATPESTASPAFLPSSRVAWPYDKRRPGLDKRTKQNKDGKRADLEREIDEGIEIVRTEEEELVEYPDVVEAAVDNVMADIRQAVEEGHTWGRAESDRAAENGLDGEDGRATFTLDEEGVMTDALPDVEVVIPDEASYPRELEGEQTGREPTDDKPSKTHGRDESEDVGEKKTKKKKLEKTSKDVAKKGGKKNNEERGEFERVEKVREDERDVGTDDWVGSYEVDSQEYVLRWPTGEMEGGTVAEREMEVAAIAEGEMEEDTVAEREMDGGRVAEREMDGGRAAEREMDGGRVAEREMEVDPIAEGEMDGGIAAGREMDGGAVTGREMERDTVAGREMDGNTVTGREMERATVAGREWTPHFATWREVTAAPTVHDPRSSADSEDQARRVVVYESEGEDSAGDKVEQLHSKVAPWTKGKKRY